MSDKVSRRNFVKTAGIATGVMIASGRAPFTYAQNEKLLVGCVGTGGQGTYHVRDGLLGAKDLEIAAICDCYFPHQDWGVKWGQISNAGVEVVGDMTAAQRTAAQAARRPNAYYDYRQMLEKEKLDAVVIATPLFTHHPITMAALDAGCNVFTEKTMCPDVDKAREIVLKANEKKLIVQVGHQRRYNPLYNMAAGLMRNGDLGRIIHMDMQWHRNNDWLRPVNKSRQLNDQEKPFIPDLFKHLNWRLFSETSMGLMTELATHQLDVATWFMGKMPSRVTGWGGLDYWRDMRDIHDNVNLIYEYDIDETTPGYWPIKARNAQVQDLINKPYKVRLCYSSILANAKKGCSELVQGDQATIELTETGGRRFEEATAKVQYGGGEKSAEEAAKVITSGGSLSLSNKAVADGTPLVVDNTKSVDQLQFIAFSECIKSGTQPKSNMMVGLQTSIMALTGYRAVMENKTIDIDPAWCQFDFPTPDPGMIS